MSLVASNQATSDNMSNINPLLHKANNLRIAVINCQGVRCKRAELENMCDYMDPDVLILTETKLDHSVNSSEFLPEHYKGDIRRDNKKGAGGVMIAYKDSLVAMQAERESTHGQCGPRWNHGAANQLRLVRITVPLVTGHQTQWTISTLWWRT